MFWILFIGCLLVAVGDGESNSVPLSSDFEKLVQFFNNLFFHTDSINTLLYFEGDMDDVHGELGGKVKVGLKEGITVLDNNLKISHPDANTKICSMDLVINNEISIDSIKNGVGFKLSRCRLLLQFSVSNQTEVTIKSETVLLYGCDVKRSDDSLPPWGPQVTEGLSNLLKKKAEELLDNHYNSTSLLSYDHLYKMDAPAVPLFQDVLNMILISS